jgi:catechol 2,3-dioxygenase-like lactoylglutathione lyase family enzyme
MQNYRVDHVHLYSPHVMKTAEWYEKMFGARRRFVREDPGDRIVVELEINNMVILVSDPWDKTDPNTRYGLDHFGITTDNIEAAVAELKAQGAEFTLDITHMPVGDISFLRGPDGTLIEVLQIKE